LLLWSSPLLFLSPVGRPGRFAQRWPTRMDAKRENAIAGREAERRAKNDAIKAEKQKKAKEREDAQSAANSKKDEEDKKSAETQAKREKNIADKERKGQVQRDRNNPKPSSKYSKKDVMELKEAFDEYDTDKSGMIDSSEFAAGLRKKKEASAPRPGEKSTLKERQANTGLSISDLSEAAFEAMDKDHDGSVTFAEMLMLMFPKANEEEKAVMLSWVEPEPEPEPEPKPELSAAAKQQIKQLFKLYDKDKSGTLTFAELKKALEKTGVEPDEIKGYMKSYDTDKNDVIDLEEFTALMESTGAFDEC